MNSKKI